MIQVDRIYYIVCGFTSNKTYFFLLKLSVGLPVRVTIQILF